LNREYDQYVKPYSVSWFRYVKVTLIDQTSHASEHWFLRIWYENGWCQLPVRPPANIQ
jgi:hypothetical protein